MRTFMITDGRCGAPRADMPWVGKRFHVENSASEDDIALVARDTVVLYVPYSWKEDTRHYNQCEREE